MNISLYELSLIAGGFTIIGALITIGGAHRLSIHLESIRRKHEAAAQLRAAFAPTLSFLYIARRHGNHDKPDIDIHIKTALLSHGAAVEMFRPFVSECNGNNYQQAWEEYRENVTKDQYSIAVEPRIEKIAVEEFLEIKIHNILQYAENK